MRGIELFLVALRLPTRRSEARWPTSLLGLSWLLLPLRSVPARVIQAFSRTESVIKLPRSTFVNVVPRDLAITTEAICRRPAMDGSGCVTRGLRARWSRWFVTRRSRLIVTRRSRWFITRCTFVARRGRPPRIATAAIR